MATCLTRSKHATRFASLFLLAIMTLMICKPTTAMAEETFFQEGQPAVQPRAYIETVLDTYTHYRCDAKWSEHERDFVSATYKELRFPNTYTRQDGIISIQHVDHLCAHGGNLVTYQCYYSIS